MQDECRYILSAVIVINRLLLAPLLPWVFSLGNPSWDWLCRRLEGPGGPGCGWPCAPGCSCSRNWARRQSHRLSRHVFWPVKGNSINLPFSFIIYPLGLLLDRLLDVRDHAGGAPRAQLWRKQAKPFPGPVVLRRVGEETSKNPANLCKSSTVESPLQERSPGTPRLLLPEPAQV